MWAGWGRTGVTAGKERSQHQQPPCGSQPNPQCLGRLRFCPAPPRPCPSCCCLALPLSQAHPTAAAGPFPLPPAPRCLPAMQRTWVRPRRAAPVGHQRVALGAQLQPPAAKHLPVDHQAPVPLVVFQLQGRARAGRGGAGQRRRHEGEWHKGERCADEKHVLRCCSFKLPASLPPASASARRHQP